jgi:hypothetical protein
MHRASAVPLVALAGLLAASPLVAQTGRPLQTIEDGILDEIRLFAAKPPAATRIVIRPFSATEADITEGEIKDETRKMMAEAPPLMTSTFVEKMKALGPYTDVAALDGEAEAATDTLIVEGKFIEMDPGSRAKRYFVGFGAGKSGVTVEGTVKSGDGTVLATFKQRRVGVMGLAGGDSMGKLRDDTKNIAEDIAKFLNAWAKGAKLK